MFGLPIGLLIRVGLALALAAACAWAWHAATGHYITIGEQRVQTKWDAAKAEATRATAAVEAERDAIRAKAEKAIQERDHERELRQADARARARALPAAVAGGHFPGVARQLLNDAVGDPAAATGAAGKPDAPAAAAADDSSIGAVAQWGVEVVGVCRQLADQVIGWQQFYGALRASQSKEQPK